MRKCTYLTKSAVKKLNKNPKFIAIDEAATVVMLKIFYSELL